MSKKLFSIHGIRTGGEWQDGAQVVVDPFFDYKRLKYEPYRRLAIFKLAAELVVLIALASTSIWLWASRASSPAAVWITIGVIYALIYWIIRAITRDRMDRVLDKIYLELIDCLAPGDSASVVAHSLGTLLLCNIFEQYEGIRLETVILDGCVVRRNFPWAAFKRRFSTVFNEIGGLDLVPYVAVLLKISFHGIGAAGALGFCGEGVNPRLLNPSEVGPMAEGYRGCCPDPEHNAHPPTAAVHNVRHPRLGHSGYHNGLAHARDFWLPRLLNLDPVLYKDFYQACESVASEEELLATEREKRFQDFKKRCFGWTRGGLGKCIEKEIHLMGQGSWDEQEVVKLVDDSLRTLCRLTRSTIAKLSHSPPPLNDEQWRALDPRTALKRATFVVVDQAIKDGKIRKPTGE